MSLIGGISSSYGYNYYDYNNGLNSGSWTEKANSEAEQIKTSLGISSTNSTNSTSSTSSSSSNQAASSVSGFLMGYQTRLEDLESSAAKLQFHQRNNVFSKFDDALSKAAANPEGGTSAVQTAADNVVSAVKDFVDKYNNTMSYLKNNKSMGTGITNQIDSFQRAIPSEETLKAAGITVDTSGNLKLDENVLKDAMDNAMKKALGTDQGEAWDQDKEWDKDWSQIKDILSGQYGIADRVGTKATYVLDSSVDRIVGDSSSASSTSSSGSSSSSSSSSATSSNFASKNSGYMSDSFLQFASFAKSGAYNLSNYYAVSMLNILV